MTPSRPQRVLWLWGPVLLCVGAIQYGSVRVVPALAPPAIPHLDKLIHAAAYGLLTLFLARAILGSWQASLGRAAGAAAAAAPLFGVAQEIVQSFLPPRTAELGDALANALGAALAAALWRFLMTRLARRGRRIPSPH